MSYKRISILAEEITDYIRFRRASGTKFVNQEDLMNNFDAYLAKENYDSKILNREIVMSFCGFREGEKISNQANRTTTIRGFLDYLVNVRKYDGTFNNIPSVSNKNHEQYIPYIFTEEEIERILYEAHHYKTHTPNVLPNIRNLIPAILETLYCTGMRLGEVISLKVEDVDIDQGIIYIREAKNYNKRIVTMSDSLKQELLRYCEESRRYNLSNVYFFDVGMSRNDGKIDGSCVYRYFREILKKTGIEHKGKGNGPRLHDLRHTFCCHSLKKLSKMDGDINAYIVYLCTFLGHKSLRETQKYIWLTEELFEDTNSKLEEYTYFISDLYEEGLHEESV
ncbi:MAG: tyrosine-type recombinase/integrase [Erysipelotrichaceae bacterium]|nr:tyrosine-type recombinase/integrase [Erysipelotrichaceae bacterium]